jgi:murein DD-endopeptidase MepM/ murein hydrolase activator NlpD
MLIKASTLALAWVALLSHAANAQALAAACDVSLPREVVAGGLVIAEAPLGTTLTLAGKTLQQAPNGQFVFGAGRDVRAISMRAQRGTCEALLEIAVLPRKFKTEVVNGVPQHTVTPDPTLQKRILQEGALIGKARALRSDRLDWQQPLQWPALGRISGVYGSQRIVNKKPLNPHLGLDIAAPSGTPVYAALAGKVSLRHDDMVMTGKTLIIDHGFGISTLYMHLSRIDVAELAEVSAGQLIAAIGSTGRSSGPHLHFQVHWFQEKLDPQLLLPSR